MKKLIKILKKITISAFILYGYNLLMSPLGLIIPINVITLLTLTLLGFPALFSFILILIIAF